MRAYQPKSRSVARAAAARLLANVSISAEIQSHLKEKAMSADEVLARLADHGRADIGEYLDGSGRPNIARMKADGATHLIKEIRVTRRTTTKKDEETVVEITDLKLHDAQAAIVHIGRHHVLFTDKKEVNGQIEHEYGSLAEWKAERDRRVKEAAETMTLFADEDDKKEP